MRCAVALLILLMLPGLVLPGMLQLCLCDDSIENCCGSEMATCCCAGSEEPSDGPVYAADARCDGCVSLTIADSELRMPAPEPAPLSLPERALTAQLSREALCAAFTVARPSSPRGAAPPGAPLPLRI